MQSAAFASVVDAAARQLRDDILAGRRPGGCVVTERDVMEALAVSRPTARAALAAVIESGLLRRRPNASPQVPEIGGEDLRDLFGVRAVLEGRAIELAVGAGADFSAARRAVRTMERAAKSTPRPKLAAADLAFHRALIDASGSNRLNRFYDSVAAETQLTMIQSQHQIGSARIAREHAAILLAAEAGDAAAATLALRAHLFAAADLLASASG